VHIRFSKCFTSIFLGAALATAGAGAAAQENPPAGGTGTNATVVVVTAARDTVPKKEVPAAASVIQKEDLDHQSKGIAADEALKLVPGVKVDNQADGERVHLSIRGVGILTERGVRGIQVLVDGIPLNDPSGFASDLFDVDWSTVERVEVLRGPSAAFYGGGAAGGVVNITTRDGHAGGNGEADATLGSYGFWKVLGEVRGANSEADWRVSASRMMGDGYRVHTAYHGTNISGKLRWAITPKFTLKALVMGTGFFNENAEGLNSTWLAEDRRQANPDAEKFNELQDTDRTTVGITGELKIRDDQEFTFTAYDRWTKWREAVPSAVQHRTLDNPGLMTRYTWHAGRGEVRNHLSFGADLAWQNIDEYKHPNLGGAFEGPETLVDQSIDQRSEGFFVADRVDFNPRWNLWLNVRHDSIHHSLDDLLKAGGVDNSGSVRYSETTSRVGVCWNPNDRVGLYASWGEGFLPPATEELFTNPDHQGGLNASIGPADSKSFEVGVRGGAGQTFRYDVTLFHLSTDGDFERYRVSTRPLETFYRNAGKTDRTGLELYGAWSPVETVTLQAAYTYSDFTYDQMESLTFGNCAGNRLPNIPRHQATLDLRWIPTEHWRLNAAVEMLTRAYVDPTNVPFIGGYTLYHADLAYEWKGVRHSGEVFASVRNATDKEYIAFTEPDPDGNSYQPAATRELFAGVKIRFGS